MEDPQLAAMMVANAKKQALENTRAHWNNRNNNHEQIVESSTGAGEGRQQRTSSSSSSSDTPMLALQASLLREAANSLQEERRQQQSQNHQNHSSSSSYSPMHQQQEQQQHSSHYYAASDVSSSVFEGTSVFGGTSDFSQFSTSNISVPSTGVETYKASNVGGGHHRSNPQQQQQQQYDAASDVSSSYYNSDFSIPSVDGEESSDVVMMGQPNKNDYYSASPRHYEDGTDPNLKLMIDGDDDSSSSGWGDNDDDDKEDQDHGADMMYPVSPLDQLFGPVAQPPTAAPPAQPKIMVPMSANLVLPIVDDSESEDGMMHLFTDRSPAESPIPPPFAQSPIPLLRDEPLQFIDSPSRRPMQQQQQQQQQQDTTTTSNGGFAITPTKYNNGTTTQQQQDTSSGGFTVTPTKYTNGNNNNNNNNPITPTKTPKMSNTQQSRTERSNNHNNNIVYQGSTTDDDTIDEDDIQLIDKRNITLSSDPLNELSRFEDEPRDEEDLQEFPICAEFSNWTRRNRGLLCLLISIVLLTSILIVVRTITANNQKAVQDTPPNLADTIKLNRTDDDDFQIVIVDNAQDDDTTTNNDNGNDDGPATISTTPDPTMAVTTTASPALPNPSSPTAPRPTGTPRPTPQPTNNPTRRPTQRPTLIRRPTSFPTIDPFGFNREQFLFQVATEVSSASSLLDDTTPQYLAFQWMVNEDDPNILDPLTNLGKGNDIAYYEQVIDRYVMALLYFSTGGPNWRLQYNFLSARSICEWNDGGAGSATEGVTCSLGGGGSKGYVIDEIVLDVNSLDGMIPREIGQFTSLQKLTMGSNNLFGVIPTELGALRELTYLGLQRNYLIGSVPAQLGRLTKLTGLVLHDTGLNGRLPSTFDQLQNLSLLFLEATSLTGDLDAPFCSGGQIYQMFYANCRGGSSAFVRCSCCTHCCFENGGGCQRQATSRSDNDGVLNR